MITGLPQLTELANKCNYVSHVSFWYLYLFGIGNVIDLFTLGRNIMIFIDPVEWNRLNIHDSLDKLNLSVLRKTVNVNMPIVSKPCLIAVMLHIYLWWTIDKMLFVWKTYLLLDRLHTQWVIVQILLKNLKKTKDVIHSESVLRLTMMSAITSQKSIFLALMVLVQSKGIAKL